MGGCIGGDGMIGGCKGGAGVMGGVGTGGGAREQVVVLVELAATVELEVRG